MKRITGALLALALALALFGCGRKEEAKQAADGFTPALDVNTECEISVVGSYNNFESLEAAFDRFNAIYPKVQLTFTRLDDYNNTISTALEGNDAPNIYTTYSWMVGKDAYAPCLEHAENLADPALKLSLDILRPGILLKTEDGTLPMVPVFSTTSGMLVNEDLFRKEGLEIPTTLPALQDTCAKLREKGYRSPIMGYNQSSANSFIFTMIYPCFCGTVADQPETIEKLNALDPAAGEAMRPALALATQLIDSGCIDLEACAELEDNYEKVILRFFEGDVPMMVCAGDTVSGTRKRESLSEAFAKQPFAYSFWPVPLTEAGGYFLDSPSLQFSVNKSCENLDMTNEFMRFLISGSELEAMAENKRLVTPTRNLSFDSVYAPFGQVPAERVIAPEAIGMMDNPTIQLRGAAYAVVTGEMTIDEAVAAYGTFK